MTLRLQLAEDIAFHGFYSFNLYRSSLQRRYTLFEQNDFRNSHTVVGLSCSTFSAQQGPAACSPSAISYHLSPPTSLPKIAKTPALAYSLPSRVNALLHHLDQGYGERTGTMHLILLSTIVPTPPHRMLKGFWVNWNESSA